MKEHPAGFHVSTLAAAKINLALHVTGLREDNYHLLDSWVCFADYGDQLTIDCSGIGRGKINFEITGPFAGKLIKGSSSNTDDNLVVRAAELFIKELQSCSTPTTEFPDLHIILEKNLPIASGIGGGSADAAALLVSLQRKFDHASRINISELAIRLGADVPMCLDTGPKRVRGVGEQIRPVSMPFSMPLLLVNCGRQLSTPEVFNQLQKKNNSALPVELIAHDQSQTVDKLLMMRNDLEPPAIALAPEIQEVLDFLDQQEGCVLSRMSGSGATCFGIFETRQQSNEAMTRIKAIKPSWWVKACSTFPTLAD